MDNLAVNVHYKRLMTWQSGWL